LRVTLKINNRKILSGIAETIGEANRIVDITIAIDKLEKIGNQKVNEELVAKGVAPEAIDKLQPILALSGNNLDKLSQLENVIGNSLIGRQGIEEMRTIFNLLGSLNLKLKVEMDLTLARGLNYYTGAIFEVKANDVEMGSITGGGRYDDLTGIFGMPDVSGVGISFGADRIYDVMLQLNLFPGETLMASKVFFVNFGEREAIYLLPVLAKLRTNGVACELYPDAAKMNKQMNYANRKAIPFVVLAGESEMAEGKITLKNMATGTQSLVTSDELLTMVSK
jgi:histidyl-tRNA synthetase